MSKMLSIRFLGTRGNLAPSQPSTVFGNHTTAVEISPGEDSPSFIVDLGTGAAGAAAQALARGQRHFDVLMTHLHHDHISGVFSFAPLYRPDCRVRIHSVRSDTEAFFAQLVQHPLHPIRFQDLAAKIEFFIIPPDAAFELPGRHLTVSTARLPHPQGCTGYRFDDGRNALVFATDIELARTDCLDGIRRLLAGPYPAGLAVFDGFFTPEQLSDHAGWGHSSWEQARDICQATGVGQALITHHHPNQDDDALLALENRAGSVRWARESQTWSLTGNQAVADDEREQPVHGKY